MKKTSVLFRNFKFYLVGCLGNVYVQLDSCSAVILIDTAGIIIFQVIFHF